MAMFICQQCGEDFPKWFGQCPSCRAWNSLVEAPDQLKFKSKSRTVGVGATPVRLSSIKKADHSKRISTDISELDRVLGGGVLAGMAVLVAGEPGIGKSTLLLQVAGNFENVIYVAGEESASQLAVRANRLGIKTSSIDVLEETNVDEVIGQISKTSPIGLIIVDSIQSMTTFDLSGGAGSIGQVRECAFRLVNFAKRAGIPLFLVGQINKEGAIAGPRVLEHMVDTVLWFEGDRREFLRVIRCIKNRFGGTDEVGVFSMEERGLAEVSDPSKVFLEEGGRVPGSAVTVVLEGTRPILVEVQALVVPTKMVMPRRVASGIDSRRLEIIIAVLTRHAGVSLWDHDVFVNVAGGIAVSEPAADLAIALSISSSFYDKPVSTKSVAIGEIGLLGEVREAMGQERRLKEARRLGFKNAITSKEAVTLSQAVKKYIK